MIPVVITSAPRDVAIQHRCYDSIRASGFEDIVACAEPGTVTEHDGVRWFVNLTRRGQFQNFVQAVQVGLLSGAEHFITAEDDVVFCRDVAALLDELPWPSPWCGMVQLYTSAGYLDGYSTGDRRPTDRYPLGRRTLLQVPHAFDMLGACALLWRRDAAAAVAWHAVKRGWRGTSYGDVFDPVLKKDADTFVGETLVSHKYEIWIHNPSLVDHIGEASTLGHDKPSSDRRRALNFPGETASAFDCVQGELTCG